MKKNKLKITTITLLIVLLTMIAFVGVYVQVQNRMENKVKDYQLAMELDGARIVTLKVSEDTTSNSEDALNVENYNKSKKIIEDRLNKLNVQNYKIRLNEKTGEIVIELTENDETDNLVSNINTVGKLEIIDTQTEEVLLSNADIQNSNTLRSTTSTGTSIYLTIEFNGEGKKKLEDITNTYVPQSEESTDTEESTDSETESTDATENADSETENNANENSADSTETTETAETEETSTTEEKTITLKIDDEEIMTTSFEEPITDGIMHLSVGRESADRDTVSENIKQAQQMTAIIAYGNMPVQYDISTNTYIEANVSENLVNIVIIGGAIVIAIALIFLMIKYKSKGLLSAISYVGLLSILLLIIRYTNVVLSIEGISAIFIVLILNYIFINKILRSLNEANKSKESNSKNTINIAIKDFIIKIIPILILAITFSFMGWIPTSSFGMVMFWGIALIILYNLAITKNLLKYSEKK